MADQARPAAFFSGVLPNPSNYPTSERFRKAINIQLDQMGSSVEWFADTNGNNLPDPGEIRVATAQLSKYKIIDAVPLNFSRELADTLSAAIFRRAQYFSQTLDKFANDYEPAYIIPQDEFSRFPLQERIALGRIVEELGPLVNELYLTQHNSTVLKYLPQLRSDVASGKIDPTAWVYAQRIMSDDCPAPYHKDVEDCSLYPIPPDRPPINDMMPRDMQPQDWEFISQAYKKAKRDKDEIFRPDTVIEWEKMRPADVLDELAGLKSQIEKLGNKPGEVRPLAEKMDQLATRLLGAVRATPMPLHPRFADICRAISRKALELANMQFEVEGGLEFFEVMRPQIVAHLKAVSNYFRTGTLEDAKRILETIISQRGGLRVAISPGTESYWADNSKFAAMMWVGSSDPEARTLFSDAAPKMLPVVEDLARTKTPYKGEGEKKGADFAPIRTLYYGGFLRGFPHGTPAGWQYPNFQYDDFKNSQITLAINVMERRNNVELLGTLLGEESKKYYTSYASTYLVAAHENGHFAGPSREYVTPSGATMGAVFGNKWEWAEELKADMVAFFHARKALANGDITLEQAKQIFYTTLLWHLNIFPMQRTLEEISQGHNIAAAVIVGLWFKNGLLTVDKKKGKLVFKLPAIDKITAKDMDKMFSLGEQMFVKIVDFQARGDLKGYIRYAQGMVSAIPDDYYTILRRAYKELKIKTRMEDFHIPAVNP